MRNCRAGRSTGSIRLAGVLRAAALAAALASPAALAAQSDICENKAGADLIRCIEAAARAGEPGRAPDSTRPAPAKPPAAGAIRPAPPAAPPATPPAAEAPRAPAEDCTGRKGEAMRSCLAAGGRLSPEAATIGSAKASPAFAPVLRSSDSCEGRSGEALRLCIEAQAKDAPGAHKPAQDQVIACTGYHPADQQLCLHRNTALVECRNKGRYPDYDVCVRSYMVRAPSPQQADCRNLSSRARTHCEARNRVYASCTGDKLGYFTCLEQRLGPDAVLTRR